MNENKPLSIDDLDDIIVKGNNLNLEPDQTEVSPPPTSKPKSPLTKRSRKCNKTKAKSKPKSKGSTKQATIPAIDNAIDNASDKAIIEVANSALPEAITKDTKEVRRLTGAERVEKIKQLRANNPNLSNMDISRLVGCGDTWVGEVLRDYTEQRERSNLFVERRLDTIRDLQRRLLTIEGEDQINKMPINSRILGASILMTKEQELTGKTPTALPNGAGVTILNFANITISKDAKPSDIIDIPAISTPVKLVSSKVHRDKQTLDTCTQDAGIVNESIAQSVSIGNDLVNDAQGIEHNDHA